MVGFADRVWRTVHRTNGSLMADLAFQTTWETSRKQEGRAGVLTNFTGARHGIELGQDRPPSRRPPWCADLEAVAGHRRGPRGPEGTRFHWPSHPWTRGSYASYGVGQWTTICGAEGEAVGRLHFAGEHCSLSAQGFMEGGCETGETAAAAILEQLGVSNTQRRRAS
jgi:monoamine oxidase